MPDKLVLDDDLRARMHKKLMELQSDQPDYWETILDHLMPIIEQDKIDAYNRGHNAARREREIDELENEYK